MQRLNLTPDLEWIDLPRDVRVQVQPVTTALIYAARVNEKAGRTAEAVKLYRQALEAISGREEEVIAVRRRAVEEALDRLEKEPN